LQPPAISHSYTASDALKFVDAKIGEFESSVSHPDNPKNIEWVKLKLKAMFQADQYIRRASPWIWEPFRVSRPIQEDQTRRKMQAFEKALAKASLSEADWKLHDELLDESIRIKQLSSTKIVAPPG